MSLSLNVLFDRSFELLSLHPTLLLKLDFLFLIVINQNDVYYVNQTSFVAYSVDLFLCGFLKAASNINKILYIGLRRIRP